MPPIMESGLDTPSLDTGESAALPPIPKPLDGSAISTSEDMVANVNPAPTYGHGRVQGGQTDSTGKRRVQQPNMSDPMKFFRDLVRNPGAARENHFERRGELITEGAQKTLEEAANDLVKMKKQVL